MMFNIKIVITAGEMISIIIKSLCEESHVSIFLYTIFHTYVYLLLDMCSFYCRIRICIIKNTWHSRYDLVIKDLFRVNKFSH